MDRNPPSMNQSRKTGWISFDNKKPSRHSMKKVLKDCRLLSNLFISCQSRKCELQEFFRHENQSYAVALSEKGKLTTCQKSQLAAICQTHATILFNFLPCKRSCKVAGVNAARLDMFARKQKPYKAIPSTRAALLQHAKCAAYRAGCIWSQLTVKKSKGKFLYSTVSSPQDCSKRFTLYFPDRPVHSDTISASLES